jgi:hypothetical protein
VAANFQGLISSNKSLIRGYCNAYRPSPLWRQIFRQYRFLEHPASRPDKEILQVRRARGRQTRNQWECQMVGIGRSRAPVKNEADSSRSPIPSLAHRRCDPRSPEPIVRRFNDAAASLSDHNSQLVLQAQDRPQHIGVESCGVGHRRMFREERLLSVGAGVY